MFPIMCADAATYRLTQTADSVRSGRNGVNGADEAKDEFCVGWRDESSFANPQRNTRNQPNGSKSDPGESNVQPYQW